MFRTIKLTQPEHDLWFVADPHNFHNRDFIYGPRGFASVTDYDEAFVHNWNAHLTDRSICVCLGDIQFADPDGSRLKALLRRLKFKTLYLLIGNHVSGHLQLYKETIAAQFPTALVDGRLAYEVYPLTHHLDGDPNRALVFLPVYAEFSVGGQLIVCCHYPIASHNKQGHGSLMLAGHCHGNFPLTNKDTGQGLRLDVGVDSFGRPVSLTEIKAHLRGRDLNVVDHHGKDT